MYNLCICSSLFACSSACNEHAMMVYVYREVDRIGCCTENGSLSSQMFTTYMVQVLLSVILSAPSLPPSLPPSSSPPSLLSTSPPPLLSLPSSPPPLFSPHRTTQFASQYAPDASILSNSSISATPATMMGGLPQTVIPSSAFYDPHLSGQGLGHLEMGHSAGHATMTHSTRAHPETVSGSFRSGNLFPVVNRSTLLYDNASN